MSFELKLDPRRRTYVRLIGQLYSALNEALSEEYAKRGLTRQKIATLLRKDKSSVTRAFSGSGNMTFESLADLAYALDRSVKISLPSNEMMALSNQSLKAFPNTETSPPARSNHDVLVSSSTA